MTGFEVICTDLKFSPPGQPDLEILKGLNLKVAPGEFLSIIGGNGTGKSTLLKAIAGEAGPTIGKITVGGRVINEPIQRRIDGVGIIHQQDDDDLLHAFSIAINVAFRQTNNGCHPNKFWACSEKFRSHLATELAIHTPNLRGDVDQLVGHLGGGQRQILNLVIATHLEHKHNPCRLILLDEHTSKLDHKNASAVMEFTNNQIRTTGTTAIMVTHRYLDALNYSDRIVVIGDGKQQEEFAPKRGTVTVESLAKAVEAHS